MRTIKCLVFFVFSQMMLVSFHARAFELEPRSRGEVMWALSGVLSRDQAHWVRNFDYHQRVPGVAPKPMVVKTREHGGAFEPEELRRLAEICETAGCRFFFVVELGRLREQLHAFPEGRRRNYQQHFRQEVRLSAYRLAPESGRWEQVEPVQVMAEHRDMVGMFDLPSEERSRIQNQQRCEFLRRIPAQTAAQRLGRLFVKVEGRLEPGADSREIVFFHTLTNLSPLSLSTIYVTLPLRVPGGEREHEFLFGESVRRVGTLDAYGSASSRATIPLQEGWRPDPDSAWVTIDGWSQEELDGRRALRERRRAQRSDWLEHENLPPEAHEMDWETEEGALRVP